MFNIYVGNAIDPTEVLVRDTDTVKDVYAAAGMPLDARSCITHNTAVLSAEDLGKTLASLGISAGDYLTVSQKLKSAR